MVVFQWEEGDGVEDHGKEEDGKSADSGLLSLCLFLNYRIDC